MRFIRLFQKIDISFGSSSLAPVYEVSVGFLSLRNAGSPETPGNCDEHGHKKNLEIQVPKLFPLVTRSYVEAETEGPESQAARLEICQ